MKTFFLFKEKLIGKELGDMDEFVDTRSVELTDERWKEQDPWSFYTFGSSASGALIFDLSEICSGVFCGFWEAIVHEVSTWGRATIKNSGICSYDAFLGH